MPQGKYTLADVAPAASKPQGRYTMADVADQAPPSTPAPRGPTNPNNIPEFKSAPPLTLGDRLRQTVGNSAIGHALESSFPRVADTLGITPTETVSSPDYEAHRQQLVAPEYLIPRSQNSGAQVGRGALKAIGSATSAPSLASTAAIAATGGVAAPLKYAPQALKYGMAIPAVKGLYENAADALGRYRAGDTPGALEGVGGLGVNAALTLPAMADLMPRAGEAMKGTGAEILNRTVGLKKNDYARGANPGRAYLEAGNGPALTMRSLANKAELTNAGSGSELGRLYGGASAPGSPLIPAPGVEAAVNAPILEGVKIASGPGGNKANVAQYREYGETFQPTLQDAAARGGFTPMELFDVKRNIAQNANWRDQQQFNLNKVRQQNVGAIGDVLVNAVPEAGPQNAIYQGSRILADRANERANTGSIPISALVRKGIESAMLGAFGHHYGTAAGLAGIPAALAIDSVPARTSEAYGFYQAGRGLDATGKRLNKVFTGLEINP
jgi:hypothetical protein